MTCEFVHRLCAVVPAVVALACMVAAVRGARREGAARRRMLRLLEAEMPRRGRCSGLRERITRWNGPGRALRDRWPPAVAGLTAFVLVGGVPGCVVGLAAAYGVRRWCRLRAAKSPGGEGGVDGAESGLPLAGDLLAACLAAGAGPREAADAVGSSLGGPVGDRLAQTAAELRLGAEPALAWSRLGALPGAYGLARCLERAQATGVPAVEPMTRLAAECRAEEARKATARARRAGVMATAPLGLCFLPAFLTIGVAPVLIGLATRLLSGG
ncbi:type II secretion system F family protein [Streptomyces sp. NPDC004647]|uniref:type II secretion system F family protein n=1 Tax=Streptomyces sp. NPDC004647 TaxID=3154671 RepID=UPI0033A03DDF